MTRGNRIDRGDFANPSAHSRPVEAKAWPRPPRVRCGLGRGDGAEHLVVGRVSLFALAGRHRRRHALPSLGGGGRTGLPRPARVDPAASAAGGAVDVVGVGKHGRHVGCQSEVLALAAGASALSGWMHAVGLGGCGAPAGSAVRVRAVRVQPQGAARRDEVPRVRVNPGVNGLARPSLLPSHEGEQDAPSRRFGRIVCAVRLRSLRGPGRGLGRRPGSAGARG